MLYNASACPHRRERADRAGSRSHLRSPRGARAHHWIAWRATLTPRPPATDRRRNERRRGLLRGCCAPHRGGPRWSSASRCGAWPWQEATEASARFGSVSRCMPCRRDARRVAGALGIPYYVLNMADEFDRKVSSRPSPTPIVRDARPARLACNSRDEKFGSLLGRAAAWDAAAVATSYYARVERDAETGRWRLLRCAGGAQGPDRFPLAPDAGPARRHAISDRRSHQGPPEYARRLGLVTADKPESQEIRPPWPTGTHPGSCASARRPPSGRDRSSTSMAGCSAATRAVAGFTIGQRRGLGLAAAAALYVVGNDPAADQVTVGAAADLERDRAGGRPGSTSSLYPAGGPARYPGQDSLQPRPAAATLRMLPRAQAELVF